MLLAVVPEHGFAKKKPEGHVVDERLQRSRRAAGPRKIRVRPGPEIAMPVSAVMSLHAEAERIVGLTSAIKNNLARKNRVRMGRPRETNPAFIAQRYAKRGTAVQIPGDCVTVDFQGASAAILFDHIAAVSKMKWSLAARAKLQTLRRKSLNEALRLSVPRKPSSPNLNRHPARVFGATVAPRIHHQIAEPPGATPIRQSQTNKPDFVAAARRKSGENFIQGLHCNVLIV